MIKRRNRILTLVLSAVLLSPLAAQAASLEIYGKVRMSLNMASNGDTGTNESSAIGVSSNASRIGFKGTENLGKGMTALYQAEADYSFDDGGSWSGARDTYVGVQGDFGTVRAGNLSSPYKEATAAIDPFGDTPGDYNAIIRHDTRAANSIEFDSKENNGLSFAFAYMPSTIDDELPQSTNSSNFDGISVSGRYAKDKLAGSLSIENLGQGTGNPDDKATKLGVTYQMDKITTIGGVYEMIDDGTTDNSTIYISGMRKMNDKDTLKGAIGSRDSTSGASDGATFVAVGVSRQYTKNVELYALYAQVDNDSGFAPGTAPSLKGAMDGAGIAGETASSLSLGINMSFSSM